MDFPEIQSQLQAGLAANRSDSSVRHVVVALPSFSVGESLLSHYAARLPAMEHRYLLSLFMLPRIESCEIIFVCCEAPSQEVLDYYASLVPDDRRESMKARFRLLVVPDNSARSVATKLLDRPDLIADLRASLLALPAFIEPWNVTDHEVELAKRLGIPINGTSPELWPLGFKSSGRRLFVEAGVPIPKGREGVCSIDEVVDAAAEIRDMCPVATGVVIKTDDSGAGDGNQIINFGESSTTADVRRVVESLPSWYLTDLAAGGVVEELVAGTAFASPSVQLDILPDGETVVLATHEQVLGGPSGQVYVGCRFPAAPAYAARIGEYGRAVGQVLARRGAIGRFGVDFAAARRTTGDWDVFALEINLRKGGTTHPYSALRNLVPGHYDVDLGQWITADHSSRCYESTDNLVDPRWRGRLPSVVIATVADAGLQFSPQSRTGVVLHMLSCLAIDGRLGLTAIGVSPNQAAELYAATAELLSRSTLPSVPT